MSTDIFRQSHNVDSPTIDTIEELNSLKIPTCKICGTKMGTKTPFGIIMSSNYIGGDICHDCIVDHCCSTNCLMCEIGSYPNCKHLERKRFYLNEED